jgi:glycosyltransferase involved in cell wall biosynthesis
MDHNMEMEAHSRYPLVSVIIPVFSGAEFLGIALESALSQTYPALEILVVDDGSTDRSLSILQGYALLDRRIRVISQPNQGVARARNRAISEAKGEFIAPLDADDLWQPHKIEVQVRRMLSGGEKTGVVYGWWVWVDTDGMVLDRSPSWRIEGRVFESLLQINFIGSASVPLFRKHCIEQAGGYKEHMAVQHAGGCEDLELLLRIASRYEIGLVPRILLGYRRRPGSMSTACRTMWRSHTEVLRAVRQMRPSVDPRILRRAKNQFALYLAGLAFWSGNMPQAARWGLRSGYRLLFLVAPHVLRMFLNTSRHSTPKQKMQPGVYLDMEEIPEPFLPYDEVMYFYQTEKVGRRFKDRSVNGQDCELDGMKVHD